MAKLTQQQYDELIKKGLSPDKIKALATSKGFVLPDENDDGIITGFVKGVAKGLIGDVARPTTQMLQGLGQRVMAAVTPKSLEEVRETTGLKSLQDTTPEGQAVVQSLKTEGGAELAGRVAANVASFFIPTSPAIQATGRTLGTAGRLTTRAGIGLSSKEAPLIQTYKAAHSVPQRILAALTGKSLNRPITNAETALRHSLFGTESMIGVKAQRAANNLWGQVIAPTLKQSKIKVNMKSFIDELAQQVEKTTEITRKKELQTALRAFSDDYGKVGEVGLEKLQQFKEGWARFIPDKAYKGKPIANSFKEIQNMAASLARNKIYKAFPNTEGKVAYFDYGNLQNLKLMGQKAMTGSKLKGGAGSFVSGIYDKVITPIATTGGLALYKTGEGLEFIGNIGAKTIGQLFR